MSILHAKPVAVATSALAAFAVVATLSADVAPHPVHATMDAVAASMDADGDGAVGLSEHRAFTIAAFDSMDHDRDGAVDAAEFADWDMGFAHIAAGIGRDEAYASIKGRLFDVWDANGDGRIAMSEAHAQAGTEFAHADADRDGRADAAALAHGSETLGTLMTAATA